MYIIKIMFIMILPGATYLSSAGENPSGPKQVQRTIVTGFVTTTTSSSTQAEKPKPAHDGEETPAEKWKKK